MLRGLLLTTTILAASLPALAQRAQRFGRSADTWCGDNSNRDRAVHCEVRGATTNGGVTIDLKGNQWDGAGLNVETHNGGIRLALPANYSAELETGTTNGRVAIDFPVTVQGRIGRHFTTTLGAGGAKLRAITTNGGVTIHQAP